MAIAFTTSVKANDSTGTASTLALPSFATTAGQDLVLPIAIGDATLSISGITDTHGHTYTFKVAQNGTGVRTEIWTAHLAAQAGNIITITISGATTIAAIAAEYSAVNALGNTGVGSGNDIEPYVVVATQESNNWIIGALGFVCQSGDTSTAKLGTQRDSSIPAATAVGIALLENTSFTQTLALPASSQLSTARQWAATAVELRSGGAASVPTDITPASETFSVYLGVKEPTAVQQIGRKSRVMY